MTLQQLKYIIEISQCSSFHAAAQKLFITQPSLSKAVGELEKEMRISIFRRTNRGTVLTEEGVTFLSYARQVVEQADLLEQQYKVGKKIRRVFAISTQHYAFVVNAFVELVKAYGQDEYEFSLRELRTHDILEEVKNRRSELGVIYLSKFNQEVILKILKDNELDFVPLFTASPHVFISRANPLARRKRVSLAELSPYPRLTYEQGINNSFYFSEELHSIEHGPKNIIVSDRATLFNLLIGLNGYTISSGILSSDLNGNEIVSIPLISDETMDIGYIQVKDSPLSAVGQQYVTLLQQYISAHRSR